MQRLRSWNAKSLLYPQKFSLFKDKSLTYPMWQVRAHVEISVAGLICSAIKMSRGIIIVPVFFVGIKSGLTWGQTRALFVQNKEAINSISKGADKQFRQYGNLPRVSTNEHKDQ